MTIRGDIGCTFDCEAHPLAYPDDYADTIDDIDNFLMGLTLMEFTNFVIGEEDDQLEIARRSQLGRKAHQFLNHYFLGWDQPQPELLP